MGNPFILISDAAPLPQHKSMQIRLSTDDSSCGGSVLAKLCDAFFGISFCRVVSGLNSDPFNALAGCMSDYHVQVEVRFVCQHLISVARPWPGLVVME